MLALLLLLGLMGLTREKRAGREYSLLKVVLLSRPQTTTQPRVESKELMMRIGLGWLAGRERGRPEEGAHPTYFSLVRPMRPGGDGGNAPT